MNSDDDSDWRRLLTDAERARMLDDIARVSLMAGRRRFPERPWDDLDIQAGSMAARKSPVERLGFIERLLPELIQTVYHILEAPAVKIVTEVRPVSPPARARRVTLSAVLAAARTGSADRTVGESAARLCADSPEQRAVQSFLMALRRDAQSLTLIAEAAGEAAFTTIARQCAGRLQGLLAQPGWDGVAAEAAAWTNPATHRMLADGRYARVHAWARRYRQSFQFDWAHPLFTLPARETWRLYEAWGLFRVLEALLALGYAPQAEPPPESQDLFAVKNDRLTLALTKGIESCVALVSPQGERLALSYNRTYPQNQRSLSRTMQPDIALEGSAGRTWVLDPKFKTYETPGSEGDDIDQMHAYRDAVVDADGNRAIRRAWCLYAGQPGGVARPLIAYGPPVASIVGALCLRPGDAQGFERLCQLLAAWLSAIQ